MGSISEEEKFYKLAKQAVLEVFSKDFRSATEDWLTKHAIRLFDKEYRLSDFVDLAKEKSAEKAAEKISDYIIQNYEIKITLTKKED